ncbi:type IV toxin-antitoxin system AbiEi family antitoxin domain-containing protein [Solicola sp. PLA-1-18]|uniref:type IV toxin-antitoxin system AbiEi family antitoxin domain-containing protein n=1 Tax=Solicola sp. PLA-1-18 TaxID=3380532 RepID=UPI003B7F0FD7
MDDELATISTTRGGFITTGDLLGLGLTSYGITKLVDRDVLHRFRQGAYALPTVWASLSSVQRFRVRGRAVLARHGGRVALCGVSALVERGVEVWGVDLSIVDVQRLDSGSGRREAGVRHHVGVIDPGGLEVVNGVLLVDSETSLWQAMCAVRVEPGLVMVDSALHLGVAEEERLHVVAEMAAHHRGARTAGITLRLADPLAESAGETRSRYLCYEFLLPAPRCQLVLERPDGLFVGRSDLGWEAHRHLAEFDGRIKYGRLLREGQTPSDVVVAEKAREDAMRSLGWGMTRLVWADLAPDRRRLTAQGLAADLERSARLYGTRRLAS